MSLKGYDQSVVKTAYETARALGASAKVMLALFEAGAVETGFRNLNYGPDDSAGFLQQRPSQGWPDVMNVKVATTSFVQRAKAIEGQHKTAGALAQAVQRSAYPARYQAEQDSARELLEKFGGFTLPGGLADPLDALAKALGLAGSAAVGAAAAEAAATEVIPGLVGAVGGIADGLKSMASGLSSVGKLADLGMKLALPTNITRAVVGLMGIVFIFIGIAQLGRQVVR